MTEKTAPTTDITRSTEFAAVVIPRPRKHPRIDEESLTPVQRWLKHAGEAVFDLFCWSQPADPMLRRRIRAVRHYRRQVRDRLWVNRAAMAIALIICVVSAVSAVVFFGTDLLQPYLTPNTPFGAVSVLCLFFGITLAFIAGRTLHRIAEAANQFGDFYTKTVSPDGTIFIDPASDHDFGDRLRSDGRVHVRMEEVYGWYCKAG